MLDREQIDALVTLVEANRSLPREQRENFWYLHVFGERRAVVRGGGIQDQELILFSDLEILEREGLVCIRQEPNYTGGFYITPQGFRFYEEHKAGSGKPIERVETHIKSYLDSEKFWKKYGAAYAKWQQAEVLLWRADSGDQLSTIGHLCREAMQEFAEVAAGPLPDGKKADTVARIRRALERIRSATDGAFLDALLRLWGTVSDLVMRQEHAGQKEGASLTWEDARRVVFQTASSMFEIGSALDRPLPKASID